MALKTDDILLVQRGDQSYQMPASQLASADFVGGDLQAVTDKGSTTTNGATFAGNVLSTNGSNLAAGNTDNWSTIAKSIITVNKGDANDTGGIVFNTKLAGTDTITFAAGGSAYFSKQVEIGGTSASPNISLSENGNADFSGDVELANQLRIDGPDNATRNQIISQNNSTPTFVVKASGTTYVGGTNLTSGSPQPNITLNDAGDAKFAKSVTSNRTNSTSATFISQFNGATQSELFADGSATFKGDVVVGQGGFGNNTELFATGDIRVRNTIQAGPNAWEDDRNGVRMSDTGLLEINKHNSSGISEKTLEIKRGGTTTAYIEGQGSASFGAGKITLNADGSAEFSAKVRTVGDNAAFHVGIPKDVNRTPLNIYDTDNGNESLARISGDGSASFNGRVSGTVSSINSAGAFDLKDSNFWTVDGPTLSNPSSNTAGQTGVFYCTGEVNSFGNQFSFSGGVTPTIPANSIVPYFVDVDNKIRLGIATEAFV